MQNAFPATSVQEDRRRGVGLAERTELELRDHVSNALNPAKVHGSFRQIAIGLQRPSVHIRRRARSRTAKGNILPIIIIVIIIMRAGDK